MRAVVTARVEKLRAEHVGRRALARVEALSKTRGSRPRRFRVAVCALSEANAVLDAAIRRDLRWTEVLWSSRFTPSASFIAYLEADR